MENIRNVTYRKVNGVTVEDTATEIIMNDMVNIDKYGNRTNFDYKYIRDSIKQLLMSKAGDDFSGWDILSVEEKEIAVRYFLAPLVLRKTIYPTSKLIELGRDHDKKSTECRKERFLQVKLLVFNSLDISQAKLVLSEVLSSDILQKYVDFGIEGTLEDFGTEGLFDYIDSRGGTFSLSGFKSKSWIPSDFTDMEELAGVIMQLLTKGFVE